MRRIRRNIGNFFFEAVSTETRISLCADNFEVEGAITAEKPLSAYLRELADKIDGQKVHVFQVSLTNIRKVDG